MTTETDAGQDKKPLNIFIGSKGLRAGWGIALFLAPIFALRFGLAFAVHAGYIHMPAGGNGGGGGGGMTPMTMAMGEGFAAVVLVVWTLIVAMIERRPLAQLGLGMTNALPRFVQGLVVGFLMLSGLIGALYLSHAFVFDKIALHGADIWKFGAEWGLVFLLVGITEEFAFRVYLQQTLARGLNFRIAAVVMGGLFILAHTANGGETPIGLGLVFAAALLFAVSIWRTGTIWWAIGFHASWDWAQSYFYGTADSGLPATGALMATHPMGATWLSGGTTGPEGSVLAIAATLLGAVIIWVMAPKQDVKLDVRW